MKSKAIIYLALAGLSSTPYAGTMGPTSTFSYIPHVSLQFGGFWATQGRAQHIDINTLIGDDFSVDNKTSSNGLVGLGLYWDGLTTHNVDLSYGVNAFYLASTSVKGRVTQEDIFTNLAYRYSLTNWPIYFGVKADLHQNLIKKTNLTFDVGIGPNIINAHHFKEVSLDNGITEPDHIFTNHTSTAFSAMAGVGLKFNNVFGRAPLECGYRFFYLGQGNFNKTNDQVLDKLKTGDGYANAVICSVTV